MTTRIFILIIAFGLLPSMSFAQDDLYFTPSKEKIKAQKEAKEKARKKREEAKEYGLVDAVLTKKSEKKENK